MLLQSGPRQLPAILLKRLVGFKGDGQSVTAGCLLFHGQGRCRGAVTKDLPRLGESQEAVRVAPEDKTSAAGHMGEQIPVGTDDGVQVQFGPQPNTVLETRKAPESS